MYSLQNKTVLITAGPTYEPIDPVRFIGNRSSGKMGYALANEIADKGAKVYLISGPTSLSITHKNIERIDVETAEQMYNACLPIFEHCDLAILAAAVADYTIKNPSAIKIKKKNDEDELVLTLTKTKDILKTLGGLKKPQQRLVGFALETNNALENAYKKLVSKNLDCIILNSLEDKGAGFATATNKITILDKNNKIIHFELKSKTEVAKDIVAYIENN
jgi:phosphopantothenoylcysteine decarboxylase/phosphopantothenate--cysteine ligase